MGESASAIVAARLDASRKELLDLTFRNPLLNYRPLRARGVEAVDADPQAVFDLLVGAGKALHFLPTSGAAEADVDDEAESVLLLVTTSAPQSDGARRSPLALQTRSTPNDLERRLLTTFYTAHTFLEEQGVNTLFLALGQLRWYEDDHSQEARRSPLLLIPVSLERNGAGARFEMSYRQEEVGDNLSLATLLGAQFGIALPSMPEAEDLDVVAYFADVRQRIAAQKRWEVDSAAVVLGFFSFSKFQMYKDLDAKSWPSDQSPSDHPLLHALLGNGFHEAEAAVSARDQLDQIIAPSDTNTVVDADSSQALAVLDVNQGRNLVIQGPPGTGKSQTITNIIAEALGHGKRVLFVSEKMAALEVVKERMDALELGHACLELHSNKTNKKAVLAELKRTLDLGQPIVPPMEDDLSMLVAARDRLNTYCEAVNAPVAQSGLTLHHVFGDYLALESACSGVTLPRLEIDGVGGWTSLEFRQREKLVEELQALIAQMGLPHEHPFWGSGRTIFLPTDVDDVLHALTGALAATRALHGAARGLTDALHLPTPSTPADVEALAHAITRAVEAPEHNGLRLDTAEWLSRRVDMEALLSLGERMSALHSDSDGILLPEAWAEDVLATRASIVTYGAKWWRFFAADWRAARKTLTQLCREAPPRDTALQIGLLDAILERRRLQAEFETRRSLGAALFGAQWQGEQSQWNVLSRLLTWVVGLHEQVGAGELPPALIQVLTGSADLAPVKPRADALLAVLTPYREGLRAALGQVGLREGQKFGPQGRMEAQPLSMQEALLDAWTQNVPRLQEMAAFNFYAKRCSQEGMAGVADVAESDSGAAKLLLPAFRRTWCRGLMRRAFQDSPQLANFSGVGHEKVIEQFRELDMRLLQHNKAKLARLHWDNLPSGQGGGQLRVLTREFEKKARHLPLRRLFTDAGHAIQAIKPVLMMSPLSVATFLTAGQLDFDLVVFDEASQVKPVDAFGALLRGKQAVVVGDSKQLPPTNFFDALTTADGTDGDNVTSDLESILGMFVSQGSPERMLRWHYRSRHESLIAVSNQEFYDNGLLIFPSPDAARERVGLVYHYLPHTVYDRGRSSTNPLEARAVAEAVMAHAQEEMARPEGEWRTLGVAAFSMTQMQAILDQLEVMRRQNASCEPFFRSSRREPFFVKNLENVQGDERDIIFISLGYGRDANGKVAMSFGPLNRQGGERRLNVLITRARLRCEVFTNLSADDIASTDSVGVQALKHYLSYAQTGRLSQSVPSGREPDSPFEREVLARLRALNYHVQPQVGCAGYFIDLAVVDPEKPGRYLLGVECDGATYHSARSARDRDRLREAVLRAQGWRIHRIWSTDWINRPGDELRRLQNAIEEVRLAARVDPIVSVAPASAHDAPPPLARAAVARSVEPVTSYVTAQLAPIYGWGNGYFPPLGLAAALAEVVAVEGPVHLQEATRRIADAAGIGRVTQKVREAMEAAAELTVQGGRARRDGDFLWVPAMTAPPLRSRAGLDTASRRLDWVAPEEIGLAILRALDESYGLSVEELPRSACRVLGFERVSQEMKSQIDDVLRALITTKRVSVTGNTITLGE
jgi:very-short-patch-repair endonuclease